MAEGWTHLKKGRMNATKLDVFSDASEGLCKIEADVSVRIDRF